MIIIQTFLDLIMVSQNNYVYFCSNGKIMLKDKTLQHLQYLSSIKEPTYLDCRFFQCIQGDICTYWGLYTPHVYILVGKWLQKQR